MRNELKTEIHNKRERKIFGGARGKIQGNELKTEVDNNQFLISTEKQRREAACIFFLGHEERTFNMMAKETGGEQI